MGDQLEAQISVVECIHEEFGHNILEIKEELARLAKLVENHVGAKIVYPQESSLSLIQPSPHFFPHPRPRPYVSIVNNKAYRPNL